MPNRRAPHSISGREVREMERLRERGWSDADIGRRLHTTRQTVRYHLGPSGYPSGPPPVLTPQDVVDLAKRGLSDEGIAAKYGLSVSWVRQLRNHGGLKYRKGTKPTKK